MSELRKATLPLAGFGCAMALIACGSASSANTTASVTAAVAQANPVAVSPEPGTPDASPATQISFLGGAGTKVANVSVSGSSSGAHSGVLRAYSTGTGESFLPSHPFRAGERVTVHAQITAGPNTGAVSTSFTIAHQDLVSQRQFPINPGNASQVQHYSSAPTLQPSSVQILTAAKTAATPGDLFLAPYQGKGMAGPMITDQAGSLLWFHPLPADVAATNFQVQQYEGKPVLTWWQGRILEVGFGQGEVVLANDAYEQIGHIRAGNGYHEDLQEIRLTPAGTAWIDVFDPIKMNLSSLHGRSDGILTDSVIEQVDIKTGLVMWEWHADGHVPLSESHNPVPTASYPWDYIHINSVDPGSSNDLLLSSRNTWTIYDVDLHTGAIRWRLGGSHSSFKGPASTRFYWQHDAEFQPGGLVSVFDNAANPPKEKQSRGLLLALNQANHTVSLQKAFVNPTRTLLASSQGNTLSLPGGNWLLGYGGLPDFTEFDSSGHIILDGRLGKNVQDFRTYLSSWAGHPKSSPAVVAKPNGAGALSVSVSWNGATEVSSWRVLAGSSASSLAPVITGAKTGFQTTIAALTTGPYVEVQALDTQGNVIGTSAAVKT
jgi:Arylsulfotransferase (ASST)